MNCPKRKYEKAFIKYYYSRNLSGSFDSQAEKLLGSRAEIFSKWIHREESCPPYIFLLQAFKLVKLYKQSRRALNMNYSDLDKINFHFVEPENAAKNSPSAKPD